MQRRAMQQELRAQCRNGGCECELRLFFPTDFENLVQRSFLQAAQHSSYTHLAILPFPGPCFRDVLRFSGDDKDTPCGARTRDLWLIRPSL